MPSRSFFEPQPHTRRFGSVALQETSQREARAAAAFAAEVPRVQTPPLAIEEMALLSAPGLSAPTLVTAPHTLVHGDLVSVKRVGSESCHHQNQ